MDRKRLEDLVYELRVFIDQGFQANIDARWAKKPKYNKGIMDFIEGAQQVSRAFYNDNLEGIKKGMKKVLKGHDIIDRYIAMNSEAQRSIDNSLFIFYEIARYYGLVKEGFRHGYKFDPTHPTRNEPKPSKILGPPPEKETIMTKAQAEKRKREEKVDEIIYSVLKHNLSALSINLNATNKEYFRNNQKLFNTLSEEVDKLKKLHVRGLAKKVIVSFKKIAEILGTIEVDANLSNVGLFMVDTIFKYGAEVFDYYGANRRDLEKARFKVRRMRTDKKMNNAVVHNDFPSALEEFLKEFIYDDKTRRLFLSDLKNLIKAHDKRDSKKVIWIGSKMHKGLSTLVKKRVLSDLAHTYIEHLHRDLSKILSMHGLSLDDLIKLDKY